MPGITGIISPLEQDTFQNVLPRMAQAIRLRDIFEVRSWTDEQAALATVGAHPAEMLAAENGRVLLLAGRVLADETLASRMQLLTAQAASQALDVPHSSLPEPWNDQPAGDIMPAAQEVLPGQLLALYDRLGARGLQGLNGAYAVVIWEPGPRRLTIVGDRGGMQPLYYWQDGQRLVFGTRVAAVAAHPRFPRAVDLVSVFTLLAAEQMLDERTLFSAAQALPPAGLLTFESGRLEVQSYWQPALYAIGAPQPSEAAAIDELAYRVSEAVNRQLRGISRVCLLLTGGLDSRLAAAALARRAVTIPVSACTIGHERARDVRYGREIARATGLDYTLLPANPNYLADYAAECVRYTEGGLNVHAAWILQAGCELTNWGIPAVMDGVGAEAVSGRHWLAEQPVHTRAEAAERLTEARWTFSRAAGLMRPELRDLAVSQARQSIQRTINQAPAETLLGWSDYFAYRQNRRHPTGSILSEDALVLEPFFDNDLIDFAYHLPPQLRGSGTLYKKTIVQRFPEVANIGYTDSGTSLLEEMRGLTISTRLRERWMSFQRRAIQRAARNMPILRRSPYGDNPQLAIFYNHWLRTAAQPFVTGLLRREELFADFLDVQQVRQLVEAHMSGKVQEFRLIGGILTFALWREQFG